MQLASACPVQAGECNVLKPVLFLAAATAIIATPAMAGDKKPKDPKQKVTCQEVKLVGSHIPERICMTEAEWDQERANAQNSYRGINNRMNSSSMGQIPGQVSAGGPGPQ
jgi:hypothetical protein